MSDALQPGNDPPERGQTGPSDELQARQRGNIFVSYSRSDTPFVNLLESGLQRSGFQVWVDRNQLEGGQTWQREIHEALDRADIVLVVLSPDAIGSRWVRDEYTYALRRQKIVIPIQYFPSPMAPNVLKKNCSGSTFALASISSHCSAAAWPH